MSSIVRLPVFILRWTTSLVFVMVHWESVKMKKN